MLREFEQTREANQRIADEVASGLYEDASTFLEKHGARRRKISSVILEGIRKDGLTNPLLYLTINEWLNIRQFFGNVELNGEEPKRVTLTAYGKDSSGKPSRSFISIFGLTHFIELRKDHAVMWSREKHGKRTFNVRGGRATPEEVNFYRQVLDRFLAETPID